MKRMTRLLFLLAASAAVLAPLHADSFTTRLSLTKPDINSTGWGPKLQTDLDQIDAACVATSTHSTIASGVITTNNGKSITKGTTTNDQPRQGDVGEVKSSSAPLTASAATGVWSDVANIQLTAGDWLISGQVIFSVNAAGTVTAVTMGVSTTSGNSATGLTLGDTEMDTTVPTAALNTSAVVDGVHVQITSNTTYYLKTMYSFSSGTYRSAGRITALRIR